MKRTLLLFAAIAASCAPRFAPAADFDTSYSLILADACRSGTLLACASLANTPRSAAALEPTVVDSDTDQRGAASSAPPLQPEVGAITGLPIDRHDRLVHYVAWQTAGAGFDLWTTGYCMANNPRCKEGNPLAGAGHPLQIVGLKFVHIGAFAGGANALERAGHRGWAQVLNAFGVLLQVGVGLHNIDLGRQGAK